MNKRWKARVFFLDGSWNSFLFNEFQELGAFIENGPNWNLIGSVEVELVKRTPIGYNQHD